MSYKSLEWGEFLIVVSATFITVGIFSLFSCFYILGTILFALGLIGYVLGNSLYVRGEEEEEEKNIKK